MKSIYSLLDSQNEAYRSKMIHPIPDADVIEREIYILKKCKDRTVLDIGATGPMHEAIHGVAKVCYGIDIVEKEEPNYFRVDLDKTAHLPSIPEIDIIIAGEVIEHLSNAGHFLDLLAEYACPIVLTTPNAFAESGFRYVKHNAMEMVNREHVAYYSYKTLSVLFERHGFQMEEFYWYNGKPRTAEGMVCLISAKTR